MSFRLAARTDRNHKEIKNTFEKLGYFVWDVSKLKECCDLVAVGYGKTHFVEVKDGNKSPSATKLTEGEEKFKEKIDSHKGHYVVVLNVDQVKEIFLKDIKKA